MKKLFQKLERFFIPIMLLSGLIVDFITFKTINTDLAFKILGVYLIVCGLMIAFKNIYDAGKIRSKHRNWKRLRWICPIVIQFTFGALLSASLVFYWFSGTLSVSWPLLILIAVLIVSNDVLRRYYLLPVVQISVFYFITFSYVALVMPFVFNSISAWVFVLAGFISLGLIYAFVQALSKRLEHIQEIRRGLFNSVITIFLTITALYFLNVIPPIPLSLKGVEIAHALSINNGVYTLEVEKENIFQKIIPGQRVHLESGERLYAFSTIFAPINLNTNIVHVWQYQNTAGKWINSSELAFNISGGRENGYRGYSTTTKLHENRWRISVETERGQVLGRKTFKIITVDSLDHDRLINNTF
jgi:hypothetical protein